MKFPWEGCATVRGHQLKQVTKGSGCVKPQMAMPRRHQSLWCSYRCLALAFRDAFHGKLSSVSVQAPPSSSRKFLEEPSSGCVWFLTPDAVGQSRSTQLSSLLNLQTLRPDPTVKMHNEEFPSVPNHSTPGASGAKCFQCWYCISCTASC